MLRLKLRPLSVFTRHVKLMQERFRLEGDLDDFYNPFNICIHKVLTRGLGGTRVTGDRLDGPWSALRTGCPGNKDARALYDAFLRW